jgi:hypothetical protein
VIVNAFLFQVQPNVLYVSATWSGSSGWRDRVYAFSSRDLNEFNLAFEDRFRQTKIQVLSLILGYKVLVYL